MIKDLHNYIFDVMTMCNKDEWAQKFQEIRLRYMKN